MITTYTYDDIQLVPQLSSVKSRSNINLSARLTKNYNLVLPFIAAPMDTVCESKMAIKLMKLGAVGCIHRFMDISEQKEEVGKVYSYYLNYIDELVELWGTDKIPIMAAIGTTGDYQNRISELVEAGANVILIDVAHGHHTNVKDALEWITKWRTTNNFEFDIITGNVATFEGTRDLIHWGSDAVRVGIGGGSVCSTRIETGHGVPNVTAIMESYRAASMYDIPIIADGGIRYAGDIAKAIAVGADTVMLGSLLAATEESPGLVIEQGNQLFKRYRGSASLETKSTHNQSQRNVEGVSTVVPYKGGVKYTIFRLRDGLQSALSYSGSNTIDEFKSKSEIVLVTNSGINEAFPHKLKQ